MMDMARLEQAILARTFFDPESLLVAESSEIEGWCLFDADPNHPTTTVVGVHCFARQSQSAVLATLLETVESRLSETATKNLSVGAIHDQVFGLAGLNPIGYGIGVPIVDSTTNAILQEHGFHRQQLAQRMTATASRYRPPVNRDAMQMRRSAFVNVTKHVHPNPRSAASLCHLDIETHQLIDRTGEELATLNLWFSDPEAEVMNPATVILDMESIQSGDELQPAHCYLIGNAIASLADKGIIAVETVVDPESKNVVRQLEALQFVAGDRGASWHKELRQ